MEDTAGEIRAAGSRIQVLCPHLGGSFARVSPASGVEPGQDQRRESRVELKRDSESRIDYGMRGRHKALLVPQCRSKSL